MRLFGIIILLTGLALGVACALGLIDVGGNLSLTQKGSETINNSVNNARQTVIDLVK